MPSRKVGFAQQIEAQATAVITALEELESLYGIYFDSAYNSGGADEITDDDLTSLSITAAEIVNVITFVESAVKLLDNEDPTNGDYRATLNKVRRI